MKDYGRISDGVNTGHVLTGKEEHGKNYMLKCIEIKKSIDIKYFINEKKYKKYRNIYLFDSI